MSDFYDPAFGPMGDHLAAAAAVQSSNALVGEVQKLLNSRGFGPLEVDGILGPRTSAALKAFYAALGMSWDGQVTSDTLKLLASKQAASPMSTEGMNKPWLSQTAPALEQKPWWKRPEMLLGAAAVVGVVGYVAWRAGAFGPAKSLADGGELGDGELGAHKPKRKKAKVEKCDRLPDVDFADGETITNAEPVEG